MTDDELRAVPLAGDLDGLPERDERAQPGHDRSAIRSSTSIQAHEPAAPGEAARERAAELLDDRRHRRRAGCDSYPHELSGGMRQRAVIAMALALDPPLMIMDEPTTALDVVVQQEIMQQIEDLKDQLGFSILFITHDLSLLVEFSDRIAIMYAGQIVELAPARRALRRSAPPLHPGADELVPVLDRREDAADRHPRHAAGYAPPPTGCRFHPRCAEFQPRHAEIVPQLREVTPGHWVACHLYS